MDLILFVVFLALSLILITLGLYRQEHIELSLIGFVFLFLLSMVLIAGNIQYQNGIYETYIYDLNYSDPHWDHNSELPAAWEINLFHKNITYLYADIEDTAVAGSTLTHLIGYWLAVSSIIGFVGVMVGYRRGKN